MTDGLMRETAGALREVSVQLKLATKGKPSLPQREALDRARRALEIAGEDTRFLYQASAFDAMGGGQMNRAVQERLDEAQGRPQRRQGARGRQKGVLDEALVKLARPPISRRKKPSQ